jgi:hypothetical protein
MGHNRLGYLAHTQEWRDVVSLLDGSEVDPGELASQVITAADRRFAALAGDQALSYCFWLLTRIASAARKPGFDGELAELGVQTYAGMSVLGFIAAVVDRVDDRLAGLPGAGHFGRIAALALRQALLETLGPHGGTLPGLLGEDLRETIHQSTTDAHFADLSRRFFARFLGRSLQSIVDRELEQHIGETFAFATVADSHDFLQALDVHARETARIVERFAGDWFSKHHWLSEGQISAEEAEGFTAQAVRKLRDELLLQREES